MFPAPSLKGRKHGRQVQLCLTGSSVPHLERLRHLEHSLVLTPWESGPSRDRTLCGTLPSLVNQQQHSLSSGSIKPCSMQLCINLKRQTASACPAQAGEQTRVPGWGIRGPLRQPGKATCCLSPRPPAVTDVKPAGADFLLKGLLTTQIPNKDSYWEPAPHQVQSQR